MKIRSVSPLARHAPLSPSPHVKGNGRVAAPVMPLPNKQRSSYHTSEFSGRTVRQASPTGLNRAEDKHRNHSAKNHRVDDKVFVAGSIWHRSQFMKKKNRAHSHVQNTPTLTNEIKIVVDRLPMHRTIQSIRHPFHVNDHFLCGITQQKKYHITIWHRESILQHDYRKLAAHKLANIFVVKILPNHLRSCRRFRKRNPEKSPSKRYISFFLFLTQHTSVSVQSPLHSPFALHQMLHFFSILFSYILILFRCERVKKIIN